MFLSIALVPLINKMLIYRIRHVVTIGIRIAAALVTAAPTKRWAHCQGFDRERQTDQTSPE